VDAAIQATLFHHGIHGTPDKLRSADGRAFLQRLALLPDARERITIALAKIDALEAQLAALERELRQLARRQTGCRALMRLYGMGELTSLVTLCELGDVGRLSASRKAVRLAGIDIGVHRSDRRARAGKLTRQGSAQLRWALYEAALSACRPSQPRPRRLPRPEGPRPQPHPRLADHRAQARPPLLPRPARPRTRRPGADRDHLIQLPPGAFAAGVPHSSMRTTLPTSSRSCCGSHPRVAAHQRPSGRSHSVRIDP
jgi:hypothetical protein